MSRPDPSTFDPQQEAQLFHEGIELFNTGQWFDAHEVWEDIWHMASGDKKRFYQGLIQCAVTLEHLRRGNPRGALNVHRSSLTKFQGLDDIYMGINIPELLGGIENVIAPIRSLPAHYFDPATPRGQDLPFDPAKAPHIQLSADPFAPQAD